jgi:hypothetical protein
VKPLLGSRWRIPEDERPRLPRPFEGVQVTDASDKSYTLETRPNVLCRLGSEGSSSFEQVYRIVV